MKTAQKKHTAKPCLAARYTYPESDDYASNAVCSPNRDLHIGTGISRGSPNWSRSTVWFKRPDDVSVGESICRHVKNLQALANPTRAPLAPPESVIMSGKWAGVSTPNKLGFTPQGESGLEVAAKLEKQLSGLVAKGQPMPDELAEIALVSRLKREAAKVEAKAKQDRQAAIRHAAPSQADKQAEIERNRARDAFEEAILARKVANAEEAASDPVLWAEVENELEAEMAGR